MFVRDQTQKRSVINVKNVERVLSARPISFSIKGSILVRNHFSAMSVAKALVEVHLLLSIREFIRGNGPMSVTSVGKPLV